MLSKFFSRTKTRGTDVYAVVGLAYRIGTFDANSVSEVTPTRIALILNTWLIDSYSELGKHHKEAMLYITYFEFRLVDVGVYVA